MRKATLIRNPASGRGAGARRWPEMEKLVRASAAGEWEVELAETRYPGHAAELAREGLSRGAERIVAAGGDGTIGQVAGALAGTEATLAPLPLGTGNDLCRSLGVHRDLQGAIEAAFRGERRQIDVARWCGSESEGAFVNVAGCGFDAVVAERVNQGFRALRGTAAYLAAVLGTLRSYRPARLRLELDGMELETEAMLCAVANATSYGGGMRVAPGAELDDGLLDVVLVEALGRGEFLRAFPRVFSGTHLSHPKVKTFRARCVSIDGPGTMPVLADGESAGSLPVRFEVVPSSLWIVRY